MTITATSRKRTRADVKLRLDDYLPYKLNVLAENVREPLTRYWADQHDIGLAEWRVLSVLGEHGTLTSKAIALSTRMHKTKVSRALSVLETRGLVTRVLNEADLRESFVSLTPAGEEMQVTLSEAAHAYGAKLGTVLTERERATLETLIERLMTHSELLVEDWKPATNGKSTDGR